MTKQPKHVFPGGQYVRPVDTQPDALELAEILEVHGTGTDLEAAAACLRRQHAEIEALKARRVPLTNEQLNKIYLYSGQSIVSFARAIEAAHGIKNYD